MLEIMIVMFQNLRPHGPESNQACSKVELMHTPVEVVVVCETRILRVSPLWGSPKKTSNWCTIVVYNAGYIIDICGHNVPLATFMTVTDILYLFRYEFK
jgi:hypothetical protein